MTQPFTGTDFTFRLATEIFKATPGENIFFSPYSIAAALAMTYNGARGATRQAMATVLGFGDHTRDEIGLASASLQRQLETGGPGVLLSIANSLWARPDTLFRPRFVRRSQNHYSARVASLDFTAPGALETINGWIAQKTGGKINDLIQQEDLGLAFLILLNAIYFKGRWSLPFSPAATRPLPFTLAGGSALTIPMMHRSGEYAYFEGPDFQAASLPYGNGDFLFDVWLPAKGLALERMLDRLNPEAWQMWTGSLVEQDIEITLPRFKLEYTVSLVQVLSRLGMAIAFGPGANFGDMAFGPAVIGDVRHKAMLEVNEEGSEAAAATAVMMKRGSLPVHKPHLNVNRPFLCTIRHAPGGIILFVGAVFKPLGD